jgi:pantoate--beta-alanine ligase
LKNLVSASATTVPANKPTALPRIATTVRETFEFVRAAQLAGKRVGLIPTMGALHAGHVSLVERSSRENDLTVVTIFVNPKQFSPQEDLAKYPRNLDDDLAKLAAANANLVFAPSVDEMYPPGFATYVEVADATAPLEGQFRPTHFRGVTTVVMKLFQIAPADRAYFGQKDYQQSLVVRRMAADLNLPIQIVVCPTVREPDGLAMSSRNRYLSADDRQRALVLSRSLRIARELFAQGERNAAAIRTAVQKQLSDAKVELDYVSVADPNTLAELGAIKSSAVVLIAARLGSTRLIDNEILGSNES